MLGTSKTPVQSARDGDTRHDGNHSSGAWRVPAPKGEKQLYRCGKPEGGTPDAITRTTENGIFAGYSKDKFGPTIPSAREQPSSFLRYADYKGCKLTVTENLDKFEDADKITDYAKW